VSAFQAELLGGIVQFLHVHSRDLKGSQDAVFVDPLKRYSAYLVTKPFSASKILFRMIDVYKQVELQAKQREQKLQVCQAFHITPT
jgi:hypothetical protein